MSANLRERRALRVVIGGKYEGPHFDRPALRKLPPGWVLEEQKEPPGRPEFWIGVLVAVLWVCIVAVDLYRWFA